jgi:hypothetical protein
MTPSGIKPATFHLLAQCLIQLRHRVPSYILLMYCKHGGLGSSVGIATGYGMDDPGIEYRWRRDFPHLSRLALEATQPPVQWVPSLSWG